MTDDDPYIKLAEDINDIVFAAGDPGAAPPDLFPIRMYSLRQLWLHFLKYLSPVKYLPAWFPGAWFIRLSKGK